MVRVKVIFMENSSDSNQPDFGPPVRGGKTPWDFGGVPSALNSFLERSSGPGRVLIPGCGSGYEIQAFHAAGYDVSAIDFSPAAVDQAKRVLGSLAERVVLGDFFTYDFGPAALRPHLRTNISLLDDASRWPEYVNRMADLLLPGGRLIGVFYMDNGLVGAALSDYRARSRAAFQKTLRASAE